MEALITVSLVITILISLFISVLMVAIVILGAAHAQWLLDGHFLSTQLHGIHQVIDSGHGPHGGRVPGLYVPVFPHQQHGEILRADLEVVPHVFDQNAWQTFSFHSCAPYREQRFRTIQEGPQLGVHMQHCLCFNLQDVGGIWINNCLEDINFWVKSSSNSEGTKHPNIK